MTSHIWEMFCSLQWLIVLVCYGMYFWLFSFTWKRTTKHFISHHNYSISCLICAETNFCWIILISDYFVNQLINYNRFVVAALLFAEHTNNFYLHFCITEWRRRNASRSKDEDAKHWKVSLCCWVILIPI